MSKKKAKPVPPVKPPPRVINMPVNFVCLCACADQNETSYLLSISVVCRADELRDGSFRQPVADLCEDRGYQGPFHVFGPDCAAYARFAMIAPHCADMHLVLSLPQVVQWP